MLSSRVMPGVPGELVLYLAKLLLARRRAIGTPRGSRALSCWTQAVFTLAWFRDRPDVARLGRGFHLPGQHRAHGPGAARARPGAARPAHRRGGRHQAARDGRTRVGVLGTKYTMDGPLYLQALGARGIATEYPPRTTGY